VGAAIGILERIWRDGFSWRKAGVLLLDLSSAADIQPTLFTNHIADRELMKAVDRINDRFGRGTVGLGLSAKDAAWRMRQEQLSPHYTTRWNDIPSVRLAADIRRGGDQITGEDSISAPVATRRKASNPENARSVMC
jgi:DNA polymerase V